jgi:hypothetical protein
VWGTASDGEQAEISELLCFKLFNQDELFFSKLSQNGRNMAWMHKTTEKYHFLKTYFWHLKSLIIQKIALCGYYLIA